MLLSLANISANIQLIDGYYQKILTPDQHLSFGGTFQKQSISLHDGLVGFLAWGTQ